MTHLSPIQLFIIGAVIALVALVFLYPNAFGDTKIGITLRSDSLENGLVGHWTFDGGKMISNVADSGPDAVHGRFISQATTTVPGVVGQALHLTGGYVDLGTNVLLGISIPVSISVWIKPTSSDGGNIFDSNSPTSVSGNYRGVWTNKTAANGISVHYGDASGQGSGARRSFTTDGGEITVGKWNHVVSVINSATNFDVYVNGIEVSGTHAGSGGALAILSSWHAYIARTFDGATGLAPMEGYIDDLRFYNRAITSEEIKRLYGLGATTHIGVTPLNLASTPNSLGYGLVGHWTFDGKNMVSNVADSSATGLNGMLIGQTSTTTTIGRIGQALSFDGSNDYVQIPNGTAIGGLRNNFSIGFWTRLDSTPASGDKAFIWPGETTDNGFHVRYSNQKINFTLKGVADYTTNASFFTSTGSWHHIGIVLDASNDAHFYKDGIFIETVAGATQGNVNSDDQYYLGAATNGGSNPSRFFLDGDLDDFRIYNRTLTASEIKRLYGIGATTHIATTPKSGGQGLDSGLVGHWTFDGKNMISNVADSSGQANHGALTGQTSTTTVPGVIGQALSFDGVNDYVSIPYSSLFDVGTGNVSVFGWVYLTKSGAAQMIIDRNNTAQNTFLVALRMTTSNTLELYINDVVVHTTAALNVGQWYHVGFTRVGTAVQFYLDGTASGSPGSSSANLNSNRG